MAVSHVSPVGPAPEELPPPPVDEPPLLALDPGTDTPLDPPPNEEDGPCAAEVPDPWEADEPLRLPALLERDPGALLLPLLLLSPLDEDELPLPLPEHPAPTTATTSVARHPRFIHNDVMRPLGSVSLDFLSQEGLLAKMKGSHPRAVPRFQGEADHHDVGARDGPPVFLTRRRKHPHRRQSTP